MPALSPTLRALIRQPCCRAFSATSSRLRPPNDRGREDEHPPPPLRASENPPPPPSFSPPRISRRYQPSDNSAWSSVLSARLDEALGAGNRTTSVGGGVGWGNRSAGGSAGAGGGGGGLPDEYAQELYNSQFKFMPGDVYAPNDLTFEELNARRSNRRPVKDAFDVLGINPLTQYTVLLQHFSLKTTGRGADAGHTELQPVIRVCDVDGENTAFAKHWPEARQPAENRKGDPESGGDRLFAVNPPPPRGPEDRGNVPEQQAGQASPQNVRPAAVRDVGLETVLYIQDMRIKSLAKQYRRQNLGCSRTRVRESQVIDLDLVCPSRPSHLVVGGRPSRGTDSSRET